MIPVESEVRVVFLTRSFDDVLLQPIELVTIYLHCSPPLFSVQEGHRRTPVVGRAGSRADKDERHFFCLRMLLFEVNFGVENFGVDYIVPCSPTSSALDRLRSYRSTTGAVTFFTLDVSQRMFVGGGRSQQ